MPDLRSDVIRLDGRPYPAYRDLRGRTYRERHLTLTLEHVQGDPFAAPSRLRIDAPPDVTGFGPEACGSADRRRAVADFLHRGIVRALGGRRFGGGSGKSGRVDVAPLGQEILDRSAVRVQAEGGVSVRLTVGLPAAGRRILGREAADLLASAVPDAIAAALGPSSRDAAALSAHVAAVEDQVALRAALRGAGLVAFLAEGAILPRRSGADDRSMSEAVPLVVPDSLAVELTAPHAGRVRGLAIPRGITLIVGGGYHGKSTLLAALARGVYDHVPGDGRERCVTLGGAVTIRAEDGRSVRAVDLRPFISNLPLGRDTARFDTDDASGSTSQAAAIVESLEAGAEALLVDEDTAATNFMIRDARMRRLIAAASEPITPFLDRVRQLADERHVPCVLVVGGAGDYLDVADVVLQMHEYRPRDVTGAAREVAAALPLGDAAPRPPGPWPTAAPRVPAPRSLDASRGRRERARAVRTRAIEFGDEEIDVSLVAQLVDPAQARFVADALLHCARGVADGRRSVPAILDALDALPFDQVAAATFGDRAAARRFEIGAALNRLRALEIL